MVMTLRKRVPSTYVDDLQIESDSDSDSKAAIPIPPPKRKTKRRKNEEEDFSDSDSESEKENEVGVEYENIREQRIRENRERMQKLGIFTLTSQLYDNKTKSKPKPKPKAQPQKRKRYPPLYPRSRPTRTCSRGGGGGHYLKSEGLLEDLGISIPEGWKSEVYSKEDEWLLGDSESPWTLKLDGFSEDGERLYDPDGSPCHQCRQKVLAKLTYCHKCRSPHGILCGDCLYTRYGENVLEAVKNPSWSCPVCRGICNCSRCRRTKGWDPINIQHSKLVDKGFKSVAHYLIKTRRADITPNDLNDGAVPVTVDLTTKDTTEPQQNEGSDYSAETSESDSDDSDNGDHANGDNDNEEQSVEMQAPADISNEAAVATDNNQVQVLQDPTNLEASNSHSA